MIWEAMESGPRSLNEVQRKGTTLTLADTAQIGSNYEQLLIFVSLSQIWA